LAPRYPLRGTPPLGVPAGATSRERRGSLRAMPDNTCRRLSLMSRRSIVVALGLIGCIGAATCALIRPPIGRSVDGTPDELLVPADAPLAGATIPGSDDAFYFAYGANMDREIFVERRRLYATSAEAAQAPGHELVFAALGINFVEPVFAALRQSQRPRGTRGALSGAPRRGAAPHKLREWLPDVLHRCHWRALGLGSGLHLQRPPRSRSD
jgi:hypothetical protein